MEPIMDNFVEENQESNAVDLEGIQIRQSVERSLNSDESHVAAIRCEEEHHELKLGYYPFKLSFWTEDECCKVALSFTSIQDEVRYQGCDRSGTYAKVGPTVNQINTHMERMTRYHPLPNQFYRRRGPVMRQLDFEEEERPIIWRQQFDSIRRDFESAFMEKESTYRMEWMNAFGKYWIKEKEWCKDDVEMMRWLMTGANHAMVDTCGEHVGSGAIANYKVVGRRINADTFFDNPSKLLKQELGMQLPLKSVFKLRRDARKFAKRNRIQVVSGVLDPFYWYYDGWLKHGQTCSGREVLLANNKSSFFDECLVQHFYSTTVNPANLCLPSITFRDIYDLRDDELNLVTYQHSQMNMSRELTTFAVGGPRFSRNGVLTSDTTNNGLVIGHGVVRDCQHVALAPLFRYHYELPTNPGVKYIDQHMAWLVQLRNQVLRMEDPFQDADEYGYIASQLTHLPKLVAFDPGNMLTYGEDPTHLSEENLNRTFLSDLKLEFRQRTDMSALVQR